MSPATKTTSAPRPVEVVALLVGGFATAVEHDPARAALHQPAGDDGAEATQTAGDDVGAVGSDHRLVPAAVQRARAPGVRRSGRLRAGRRRRRRSRPPARRQRVDQLLCTLAPEISSSVAPRSGSPASTRAASPGNRQLRMRPLSAPIAGSPGSSSWTDSPSRVTSHSRGDVPFQPSTAACAAAEMSTTRSWARCRAASVACLIAVERPVGQQHDDADRLRVGGGLGERLRHRGLIGQSGADRTPGRRGELVGDRGCQSGCLAGRVSFGQHHPGAVGHRAAGRGRALHPGGVEDLLLQRQRHAGQVDGLQLDTGQLREHGAGFVRQDDAAAVASCPCSSSAWLWTRPRIGANTRIVSIETAW